MGKTFKDRPGKYKLERFRKPKEKRFISSKGRDNENIKKNLDKYDFNTDDINK